MDHELRDKNHCVAYPTAHGRLSSLNSGPSKTLRSFLMRIEKTATGSKFKKNLWMSGFEIHVCREYNRGAY